jgi:hypothetical protein
MRVDCGAGGGNRIFGGDGRPHDNGARRLEPFDNGSILRGNAGRMYVGPPAAAHAGHIEYFLDGDRQAVKRAALREGNGVGLSRLLKRGRGMQIDKGSDLRLNSLDPRKASGHCLFSRDLARGYGADCLAGGGEIHARCYGQCVTHDAFPCVDAEKAPGKGLGEPNDQFVV